MKWYTQIIDHTLKTKDGRYSRMSIIITSAWLLVVFMAVFDLITEGFRYDVFATLAGIAVGTKWVDKKAESITPKADEVNR